MKKRIAINPRTPSFQRKPTHQQISHVAHALYEKEGRPEGKHLVHWFNAESMIEANFGYGESHTEHDFSKEHSLG
jgi:hypothetical protein